MRPASDGMKAHLQGGFALLVLVAAGLVVAADGAASDSAPAPATRTTAQVPDISGVWWTTAYARALQPVDGSSIPFTAQGREDYARLQADLKSGKEVDNTRHVCLPQGTPRVMTTVYPFRIQQSVGQVTLMFEENRIFRLVRLDAGHEDPKTWDPSFMGESVGRWQGRTLLIDTTNFKTVTFLDDSGLPHSDQLHVVERLRKLASGKRLEDSVTIEDRVMFTHPWTARLEYRARPDVEIRTDWVCGEPHRDVAAVVGVVAGRIDGTRGEQP